MIKIEIKSAEAVRPNGTTKKGGQFPRKQIGYAFVLDKDGKPYPYPKEIRFTIWDNEQPYAPGLYVLAPQSFYVGDFGELKVSPQLVPAPAAVQKAA